MKCKQYGLTVVLLAAAALNAAVIFQDDFSSGASSNLKWSSSLNSYISSSFIDGACKVINTDNSSYGCVPQKPMSNKPSTFTVSCKITFTGDSAQGGIGICFDPTNYSSHYISLKSNKTVLVFRADMGAAPMPCSYMNDNINELKISKSDSTFNIFINGHYFTTFTDSRRSNGDIALIANAKSTLLFDDVLMTDQYESGNKPTEFEDAFNNPELVGWDKKIYKGTAEIDNGKLLLSAQNNDSAYIYLLPDVQPSEFCSLSMDVSHISGADGKSYGFVLFGDDFNKNRAIFGICADRMYVVTTKTGGDTLKDGTSSIKGKAYTDPVSKETTFYIDTLSIFKPKDANNYKFTVNNITLATLKDLNFTVKSVGIFCTENTKISIDNFRVLDLNKNVAVKYSKFKKQPIAISKSNSILYDIMGRAVMRRTDLVNLSRVLGQGVYIDRSKKELVNTIGQ